MRYPATRYTPSPVRDRPCPTCGVAAGDCDYGAHEHAGSSPSEESGIAWAAQSRGTVWGDPAYCPLCRRAEVHSYRTHEQMVHATRCARMED